MLMSFNQFLVLTTIVSMESLLYIILKFRDVYFDIEGIKSVGTVFEFFFKNL